MKQTSYSKTLRTHWEVIALITGIAIVLSLVVSILQPFKYRASTQLLIIQKQTNNLDAYTATKSAEKIGDNLSTIVFTSSFYNDVINSNPDIQSHFSDNDVDRRKQWKDNIDAQVVPETGILQIAAYDEDKNFSAQLVRAISYTLVNKGADYHGGGSGVEIKIVDDVIVSTYPVRPNIVLNTLVAVVVGLICGSAFVIIKSGREDEEVTVEPVMSEPTNDKGWYITEQTAQPQQHEYTQEEVVPLYNSIKTMHDHIAN